MASGRKRGRGGLSDTTADRTLPPVYKTSQSTMYYNPVTDSVTFGRKPTSGEQYVDIKLNARDGNAFMRGDGSLETKDNVLSFKYVFDQGQIRNVLTPIIGANQTVSMPQYTGCEVQIHHGHTRCVELFGVTRGPKEGTNKKQNFPFTMKVGKSVGVFLTPNATDYYQSIGDQNCDCTTVDEIITKYQPADIDIKEVFAEKANHIFLLRRV